MAFDATFEVYPEVKLGDLGSAEIERVTTEVTDDAIDKTIDILRKQRRTFAQRAADRGGRRRRPRDDRLRRQDRRRAVRRRQGRRLPVPDRRRPDARAVRQGRARHEGRRIEDLPAAVPGRLPGQGRRRQGSRLHGHAEEDRGPAPARGRRGARQVAGHRRRHGRGAARRHQEEPRARGQVPRAGAQQGRGDGRRWSSVGRTRRAEGAGRRRNRADDRERPRRPEEARHQGRRQGADPGRDLPAAGRAPRAPRPGRGRTGAREQPAGQARAAAGAHRGDGAELREAGRSDALVPGRPPAHGRGRGGGDREQRRRIRARQGQGHRQGAAVRRTDGSST